MLWTPSIEYGWSVSSEPAVRPVINAWGDTLTPGNNTKGTAVQVFTAGEVAYDVHAIYTRFGSNNVSAAARDTIVDLLYDPAGGTSYTILLPDLLCSSACDLSSGGIDYFFQVFVPAGSTIAYQASINNATVGTLRVLTRLFGRPKNPELIKTGHFVEAIGIVSATSRGTLVTQGTTSEGAWTLLGTTTRDCWQWNMGIGCNNATMTSKLLAVDLGVGDGTAGGTRTILDDMLFYMDSSEFISGQTNNLQPSNMWVKAGSSIYGRMQCSTSSDANVSMAAYGVAA